MIKEVTVDKLGRDMLRVGSTAAVAEEEDLAAQPYRFCDCACRAADIGRVLCKETAFDVQALMNYLSNFLDHKVKPIESQSISGQIGKDKILKHASLIDTE